MEFDKTRAAQFGASINDVGAAVQMITKPLIKLLKKEIVDMWSYYESGFHNLLVVSVDQRYSLEALKTAYGILGEGQLSLTKTLVLVNGNVCLLYTSPSPRD